jgi:hypothetical protein
MFSIHDAEISGKPNPIVAITVEAQAIFAELIGSNACTAAGVTVVDHAPVLALCRALVTAGQDPNRPLHAYRGDVLCLCVRSIGEGARLAVEDDRYGKPRLRRWRNRAKRYGAAPPARRRCERWPGTNTPRSRSSALCQHLRRGSSSNGGPKR